GNSYEGVVVRGRMETGSWRNGTDEISNRTKRLLTSIAANARSELISLKKSLVSTCLFEL
ncbi:MAG: hypothetical protein AAF625_01825, partial [Pseudomonadota bacterium]